MQKYFNPLGGKKGHPYLHKPTIKSLLFVLSTYDLFLPPAIKRVTLLRFDKITSVNEYLFS